MAFHKPFSSLKRLFLLVNLIVYCQGGGGGLPDVYQLLCDTPGQQNHLQIVLPQLTKVGQLEAVGLLHRQSVPAGQGH